MPIVIAVVLLLGSSVLGAAVGYPLLVPLAMVIATTVWVHSDSDDIDYPDSAIEAKVLLLWIVFFPLYLYRRRELKLANAVSQRISDDKVTDMRMSNGSSQTNRSATANPTERACPECGETVLAVARKCKHCGSAIEPVASLAAPVAPTTESSHSSAQPPPAAATGPMGARLGRSTETNVAEVEGKSSRKIFVGVAVAVLALGAFLWFASTYKGPEPFSADTSRSASPAYSVGQLATTPKFGILVTEVETPSSVGNVLIHSEAADGGKYVAVQWEYQNNSSKPIGAFSQPTLYLEDASGTRYEADLDASSSYAMGLELTEKVLSNLNPGIKVRAASVFEVAASHLDRPGWMIVIDADDTVKIPLFAKPEPEPVAKSEAPVAEDVVAAEEVPVAEEPAAAEAQAASPLVGEWQSVGPLPDGEDSFSISISESDGELRAAYGSGGPFSESLSVVEIEGGFDLYFDYIEGSAAFNESFDAERKNNDAACKVKVASVRPAEGESLTVTTHEDPCGLMPGGATVTLRKAAE